MIDALAPYPEYRDSGVPWLGEVPAHWEVRKLRQVANRFWAGGTPQSGNDRYYCSPPDGYPWLMISDLTRQRRVRNTRKHITESGRASRSLEILPTGTVLFSMYASLGAASLLDIPAAVNQAIIGITSDRELTSPDFLLCSLEIIRPWLNILASSSTQANLNASKVKALQIALPPPDEQAAIVRFLDYATRRIDRAIRAKRKLVALVTEQKQAVIHRAVTRGLDPHAPMKDSGIPWLGEIPAHWEVRPGRSFLRIRKVLVGSRHAQYRLLSLTKQGIIVRDLTGMRGKFSADLGTSQQVRRDDFVLCLFDVAETPRTVGRSQHEGMITSAYTVCEPLGGCNYAYLESYLITLDDKKLLAPLYSGLRNTIPKGRFLGMKVPVPPVSEQAAIVAHLDTATRDLDATIARTQRQIDLLREYRARLVADVVTGKLDVRAAAAALPDEAPDDGEPLAPDDDDAADDDVDATDAPDEG